MKIKVVLIIILFILLGAAIMWWHYEQPGNAKRATGIRHMWHAYDTSAVETIKGTVISVEYVKNMAGISFGLRMLLQTDQDKLLVILGPRSYVAKQNVGFRKGDQVEVICSRVIVDDESVILAAEIRKGNRVLKLRDSNGIPLWSKKIDNKVKTTKP